MTNKKNYFIYILTNRHKNVLYIGVTNSIKRRLIEHVNGEVKGFSKRYNCKYLLHYEKYNDISLAILREKTIKKWRREKKVLLISKFNPKWNSLNESVLNADDEYL
jgi:putative endonuclease